MSCNALNFIDFLGFFKNIVCFFTSVPDMRIQYVPITETMTIWQGKFTKAKRLAIT